MLARILFLMLIGLFVNSLNGQDHLLIKENGKYIYNGGVYKCKELGEVYENYTPALNEYLDARQNSKNSILYFLGGLGIVTGSTLLIAYVDSIESPYNVYLGFAVVGGLVIQFASIPEYFDGRRSYKKARNLFNQEMIERHGYRESPSLSIGSTYNGIGLIYTF